MFLSDQKLLQTLLKYQQLLQTFLILLQKFLRDQKLLWKLLRNWELLWTFLRNWELSQMFLRNQELSQKIIQCESYLKILVPRNRTTRREGGGLVSILASFCQNSPINTQKHFLGSVIVSASSKLGKTASQHGRH